MLQPEEVVEVFVGDTLEEAMAFAVAALGPDLSVRRARKVRKGVQGLVGRDRYEVVAVPPPRSEGALESAFEALLSQAERAETLPEQRATPSRRTTRPHPAPEVAVHQPRAAEQQITLLAAVPMPEEALEEIVAVAPGKRRPTAQPRAQASAPQIAAPAVSAPAKAKVTAPVTAEVAVRPRRAPAKPRAKARPAAAPAGWSHQALADLGLPEAVLAGLPADEPADDLAWVVALAVAMSAVLPQPAALDDDHPLVVNGFGLAGVLGLLDAAARGLTPGTITVGTRTAAATATELALAIRTAVVG